MHELFRTVSAIAALFLASACGATNVPREPQPENRAPTPPAAPEPAAEANEVDGDPQPAAGSKPETAEQQNSDESGGNEQSSWSPETAQEIIERARRKLKRRCDARSQAACAAIPNLDKCANLRRGACASLGELFARGATGVDRNPAHARDFWWKACDIASADCLRYGKLLFDMEGLGSPQAVADRFFQMGCTSDFQLCESAGRFYQEKNELAAARKFFSLGCAAGQEASCQAKKQ